MAIAYLCVKSYGEIERGDIHINKRPGDRVCEESSEYWRPLELEDVERVVFPESTVTYLHVKPCVGEHPWVAMNVPAVWDAYIAGAIESGRAKPDFSQARIDAILKEAEAEPKLAIVRITDGTGQVREFGGVGPVTVTIDPPDSVLLEAKEQRT
jgi:hypothetical protein